jgi:hypothetical protein
LEATPSTAGSSAGSRVRGAQDGIHSFLRTIEWYFDDSAPSRTPGARRVRIVLGAMFLVYAVVLEVLAVSHEDVGISPLFIAIGALPLLLNRFGRFAHYFLPVFLGLFSYVVAAQFALQFKLGVHYTPQIRIEHWLTPGPIPTVWLQQHLYHGRTGALETFSVVMYASHFLVPLILGLALAMSRNGRAFAALMFGILTVSVLGEIAYVLAPTAPPWLAGQEGYLSGVHHILKQSLYDLHMTRLAELDGDPANYDVTAAAPSLHIAFPLICAFTAARYRLPRWSVVALALNVAGVAFAIVYTGEHYVFDVLTGGAAAIVAWRIVHTFLEPEPEQIRPLERIAPYGFRRRRSAPASSDRPATAEQR